MAPHSSTLAWKIPWVEEPGRLQSMGAGVQPQWIPGNSKRGWSQHPRKKLFNYRYEERLEKGNVVGSISGEKRLNNLVYVENQ